MIADGDVAYYDWKLTALRLVPCLHKIMLALVPVIGARTRKQLTESLAALQVKLSAMTSDVLKNPYVSPLSRERATTQLR